MAVILRLSDLSRPRQALVRLCQAVNYGAIHNLEVLEREPVYQPQPVVLVDVRLDTDDSARPELALADFSLSDEVRRLMVKLDELTNGRIDRLEIRAGLPRRMMFARKLSGVE
jgi:hypothetical protein